METDREVLIWFHKRLKHKHGESEFVDYMHRLRWIILAQPRNKTSRGHGIKELCNGMDDLSKILHKPSEFEKRMMNDK